MKSCYKIAFIILSWQSEKHIFNCLDSIRALADDYGVSVYIYDNGSIDKSVDIAEELLVNDDSILNYLIEKSNKNIGTTKSRNTLLRMVTSDTDYVCVLDSDTKINSAAITQMISALEDDEKNLIAAPRMFNAHLIEQRSVKRFPTIKIKLMKGSPFAGLNRRGEALESYPFMPDDSLAKCRESENNDCDVPPVSDDKSIYPVDYAISACWLMKREVLDIVGYLDERIFYAPEDVDYCARVREAGFKVVLASGASIYHYTQRISKRKLISRMNMHHLCGLTYYFIKHRKHKSFGANKL